MQLYVQHLNSAVDRPRRMLKAFRRVTLLPGETHTVELELAMGCTCPLGSGHKALRDRTWDSARDDRSSSADIRLVGEVELAQ